MIKVTILPEWNNYWQVNFDPEKIARYDETKIAELLQNPGIVRNRLKVHVLFGDDGERGAFSQYGFSFVGLKMVDDHIISCFRYEEVSSLSNP